MTHSGKKHGHSSRSMQSESRAPAGNTCANKQTMKFNDSMQTIARYAGDYQQDEFADPKFEQSNKDIPMGLGLSSDPDAPNNFANMSMEQRRKVITEYKQAKAEEQMGQLVDRKATDSFQG